jgi:hypothetical protein
MYDVALVKFYKNGTKAWNITWGGINREVLYDLEFDSEGNIYGLGYTESYGFGSFGSTDLLLIKFDSMGTVIWNRTWGGSKNDGGNSIFINSDDSIYCCGYTNNYGVNLSDIVLLKFDTNSNLIWNITWGRGSTDEGPIKEVSENKFTDNLITDGEDIYYYVIVAENAVGNSSISNCESITYDITNPTSNNPPDTTHNINSDNTFDHGYLQIISLGAPIEFLSMIRFGKIGLAGLMEITYQ